jgi:hypothetical protein
MNERWVCRRCFTSNDADVGSCVICGLARGSEVPAADAAADAPAETKGRGSSWTGLLRFAWIPVVLVVLAAGFLFSARRDGGGQIVGAGDMQVTDLVAGDCFDLKDPSEEEVNDVEAKPCTEPHEFEMFFVRDMPDGDFPTDDEINSFITANCLPAFASYVGLSYEQSSLDIFPLIPGFGGWNAGDHSVQCSLYDPIDEDLEQSMRDSGR